MEDILHAGATVSCQQYKVLAVILTSVAAFFTISSWPLWIWMLQKKPLKSLRRAHPVSLKDKNVQVWLLQWHCHLPKWCFIYFSNFRCNGDKTAFFIWALLTLIRTSIWGLIQTCVIWLAAISIDKTIHLFENNHTFSDLSRTLWFLNHDIAHFQLFQKAGGNPASAKEHYIKCFESRGLAERCCTWWRLVRCWPPSLAGTLWLSASPCWPLYVPPQPRWPQDPTQWPPPQLHSPPWDRQVLSETSILLILLLLENQKLMEVWKALYSRVSRELCSGWQFQGYRSWEITVIKRTVKLMRVVCFVSLAVNQYMISFLSRPLI